MSYVYKEMNEDEDTTNSINRIEFVLFESDVWGRSYNETESLHINS